MHHFVTSLVCVFVLACGGSSAPARSPGSPDIAPAGSPDLAVSATPTQPCSQEIALECPNGVDGCTTGATSVHVCVATAAQAGPSCSQEIALACPDGEIDACLLTPAAAANHICVRR